MTRDQRKFINAIVLNVKKHILEKAKDIPKDWDGFELRLFISEHFKQIVLESQRSNRKRRKEFFNICWVNNLI